MSSTSPFAQHLHTNYVPSTSELNHLRSLVDERQNSVDTLDREIEALAERRDEHAKFVKEHSALLSPIRRVPNDILSLIFLACLPHNSSRQRLTGLSAAHPALVVSHVCQRWRQLSFNTPLLWSVIDIDVPKPPSCREYKLDDAMAQWERQMQVIFEMTEFWISRSASCPLTLSFSGGLTFPRPTILTEETVSAGQQKLSRIIDVLCDVSHRWKSAYLSVELGDEDSGVARFFRIPSDSTPLLENLSVIVFLTSPIFITEPSKKESVLNMTMGGGLVKAPSLCRLAVGCLWTSPLSLPINWANITEISLGHPAYQSDPSFPLSLLAMCINLTRCSIYFQASRQVQSNGHPAIILASPTTAVAPSPGSSWSIRSLRRLRTLEVRGSEPPPSFATHFDLPSLRELTLLCFPPHPVTEVAESGAMELIRRFGHGLTDLTIDSWCLNESRLMQVLEQLPNVVSLKLVRVARSQPQIQAVNLDSVLDKLTPRYDYDHKGEYDDAGGGVHGAFYCPKLEKFGCRINHSVGFSEEALVRFIASRRSTRSGTGSRPYVPQLNSVVLAFPSRKPKKTIREGLEEMGVDLKDMVLITTYKTQGREQAVPRMGMALVESDVLIEACDHEDYVSTVGPFKPTLGGWVL
ncbi:hypothetical protein EST38_g11566 [Candolleomyces aberdarensis]|uniref:Uncharacterized protein n=1 Tax=Candolleomyces aberdarensis TaxID=2316362 RepID=A0A4V1Q293_9AGAR|nr:hypothetical protein EST38_g11566 [Candolleomyces aberdarensis]